MNTNANESNLTALLEAVHDFSEKELQTLTGLAKMLRMNGEARMLATHGEVCSKAAAARILDRTYSTITHMLDDGRLDRAANGMVTVRSIARYLDAQQQVDAELHKARMLRKHGGSWAV